MELIAARAHALRDGVMARDHHVEVAHIQGADRPRHERQQRAIAPSDLRYLLQEAGVRRTRTDAGARLGRHVIEEREQLRPREGGGDLADHALGAAELGQPVDDDRDAGGGGHAGKIRLLRAARRGVRLRAAGP
jgi:hypothetical protein